ncbi:hypothetical protein [Mycobacterium sp.]|uniref:hypothetical protein n=1 Tax=Mycobacterium sp. TaxID=1785 RepID=UPI003D6BF0C2
MTVDNEMVVYCDGPKDAPHERRVLRQYRRAHDGTWLLPHPGNPTASMMEKPGEFPADRQYGNRLRFHCTTCRLDEKHTLDRWYYDSYPPFDAVFEKLHAHGKHEISVRHLAGLVWPAPSNYRYVTPAARLDSW